MKYRLLAFVIILTCVFSVNLAQSTRHELVQTFTSPTPDLANQFGEAITVGDALDGWPMFIGSPNRPNIGRVERFINTGAQWEATNCILKQAGTQKNTGFGEALSTSGVGANALVVVGEPYFNKTSSFKDQGRVSVFRRDTDSICLSRVATLTPPVDAANQLFGASVDVTVGDAAVYVIVGAPTKDNAGNGAAYIYRSTDDGSTWTLETTLASNPSGVGTGFGYDVAIDGANYTPTAIIGAPRELTNTIATGAAYIYRRENDTWSQDKRLYPDTSYGLTEYGWSVDVAVSSTRTFVIGSGECEACGNTNPVQRLFIYERLSSPSVSYQEDFLITSRFNVGEDLVLKNQPGDANGFFMAFTSNDYYYELWKRVDQFYWQPSTTRINGTAGNRIAIATSAGLEPHLAVGQASLNKAWISAPSSTQFELLANGDFGTGTGANAGLSRKWRGVNLTQDDRRCPDESGCYYQFKGSASENSLLKQVVTLKNHTFNVGDILRFSVDLNTTFATPNLSITLAVTENGQVIKTTYVLDEATSDWDTVVFAQHTICTAPTKIVVSFRNQSAKGSSIKVDNVSLILAAPLAAPRACRLPLPVAP